MILYRSPSPVRARSITLAASGLVLGSLTACGNLVTDEPTGVVAVRAGTTASGLTVLVDTCDSSVTDIEVVGGRENLSPDRANPQLGHVKAGSAQSGRVEVTLPRPPAAWTIEQPVKLPTDPGALFIVTASGTDSEAAQVSATRSQVRKLHGSQVIRQDGQVTTEAAFHTDACKKADA